MNRKVGKAFKAKRNASLEGTFNSIQLVRESADPTSTIDPDWLEAEMNQVCRVAQAHGHSKASSVLIAIQTYQSDINRLFAPAYDLGKVVFIRGFGRIFETPEKK